MRIAIAGSTGLVGRRLTEAATAAGHDVVGLSRSQGTDLVAGPSPDLDGVDAVVDVTQGADHDERATAFFEAVAHTLAEATTAAGVPRTVVLSIVGVDLAADELPYYAAKLAHERATLREARGVRILRATQFHDFPRQTLEWTAGDGKVDVVDQRIQPVDVAEVVRVLLDLAGPGDAPEVTELAGPREESLADLVERLDPDVTVTRHEPGPKIAAGALLPGPDAIVAGPDYATWLAARG